MSIDLRLFTLALPDAPRIFRHICPADVEVGMHVEVGGRGWRIADVDGRVCHLEPADPGVPVTAFLPDDD